MRFGAIYKYEHPFFVSALVPDLAWLSLVINVNF